MPNGIFPEWLNANAGRAFPLSENASRLDVTGHVKLPDTLIVAAQISMVADYASGIFYVSKVGGFPDRVLLTVAFLDAAGASRDIATLTVFAAEHTANDTYAFTGAGSDSTLLGSLTIGDLSETQHTVAGLADFDAGSTPFEVSALFISTPEIGRAHV